jgi:hypothetical protein
MSAGSDYSYTIGGVSLPSSTGGYGPFALRTRHYANGQTVDINLNFGSVAIAKDRGSLTSLVVSLISSSTKVGASGSTLSFKFQISKDLWKYDIFKITANQYWTIGSSAKCSSRAYTGRINNFNGTRTSDPFNLDCYVTPKTSASTIQYVYIYGLAKDIDVSATDDNKYVDLRISSVSNPDADYSDSSYTWAVETIRGQTRTVIEYSNASSGVSTDPGIITKATFATVWGWATTNIMPNSAIYMNYGFTTYNKIPVSGTTEVVFTDSVSSGTYHGNTSDKCWLQSYLTYTQSGVTNTAKCTASSKTVTISSLPEVAAGTTLTFTVLVTFDITAAGGSASASIVTKNATPVEIDKGTALGSITIANSAHYKPTTFELGYSSGADLVPDNQKTDATTSYAGQTATTQTIMFKIDPVTENFTTDTQITLKFPFISSTSVQNFEFAIPTSGVSWYLQSSATPATAISTSFTYSSATVTASAIGSNIAGSGLGSFVFKIATAPTAGDVTYFAGKSASGTQISLPRFASNAATRYETNLETKDTATTVVWRPQLATYQLNIVPNLFTNGPMIFCIGLLSSMPIKANFLPLTVGIPSAATGTTFYHELDFTDDIHNSSDDLTLGSGLANGNDYPYSLSGLTYASPLVLANLDNEAFLVGKLSAAIATSATSPILYTAILSDSSNFTPYQRTYYTIDSDPRLKYVTHQKGETSRDIDTAVVDVVTYASGNSATQTIGISTAVTSWAEGGLKLTPTIATDSASSSSSWAFSFPVGWTIATGATVVDASGDIATAIVISPATTSVTRFAFKHSTMIITESGSFDIVSTQSFTIKGPVSSAFVVGASSMIWRTANVVSLFNAGTCQGMDTLVLSTLPYSMSTGSISVTSVSPNSIKGRGPASVNISETVVFAASHLIPAGGKIVVTINTGWSITTAGALTVTGLTNLSTAAPVNISRGLTDFTITSFAEVAASTSISLSFTGLLPPTYTASTTLTTQEFISSIYTYATIAGSDYAIDYSSPVTLSISAGNATGRSTFVTKTTYPQTTSVTDADLYLKFTLANSVPKGGVLKLTAPLTFKISAANAKNQVWVSPLKVSEIYYGSSTVSLTLAEDYTSGTSLEVFIDKAVDNPTTTSSTSTGFSLKSMWGDATIDTDLGQTILTTQLFKANAAPSSTLNSTISSSLTFSPSNAYEYATYSFNFKSSVKFATDDQFWIVFPDQFDPYLGKSSVWLSNEGTTYYISCSSSQLGTPWCKVDHNIVVVSSSNEVSNSTDISLTIANVKNPTAVKTDNFQIQHVDSAGVPKSYNMTFGTVTPTAQANHLEVRNITASSTSMFDLSSYTFTFYLGQTLDTTSQIKVLFPAEYDLSKDDKHDSYSCSSTYKDDSDAGTNREQQNWNTNTVCTASYNWVVLPAPTVGRAFASTDIVTLTLTSVGNPQWGQPRTAASSWDFDATDSDVWTIYDVWTSNFELFLYNTATSAYVSRSYGVLSKLFSGFTRSRMQLLVNNYSPQTLANRIVVWAGSQTDDVAISTESTSKPLSAKKVVLTPYTNSRTSDSGKLVYTSAMHSFTLWQDRFSCNFRVAAKIDLSKGLYYIDWSLEETRESSLGDDAYNRPVKTLVEVVGKTAQKFKFAVSAIPAVAKGTLSAPLKISVANAPATKVNIAISVTGTPVGVSVSPSSVTFSPDVNQAYFQISVDSTANVTSTINSVAFVLTGTDADVYSIDATVSFSIVDSPPNNSGSIVSWGLGTCTRVSCSVSPTTDQTGTIYWQLSAKGSKILSYSSLVDLVGSTISASNSTTSPATEQLNQQIADEYSSREVDPNDDETWVEFQHRVYKSHLEDTWMGADAVVTTANSYTRTFTWLYGGTKYQISGYLENGYDTSSSVVKTDYFTTAAQADSQPFTINFKGNVLQSYASAIGEYCALIQGVHSERLSAGRRTTSRLLQTTAIALTTFTYTLYTDRSAQDPTPTDQAKIEGTNLTALKALIRAAGIYNEVDSVKNIDAPIKLTPTWTSAPSIALSTTTDVTINLRASVAGETCCIAVKDEVSSVAPRSDQIYYGLSSTNDAVASTCITTDATTDSNTVLITGLDSGTDYVAYCTAVDTFPMWATHMSFTDDLATGYSFTTTKAADAAADDSSDSSASSLAASACVLAAVLLS